MDYGKSLVSDISESERGEKRVNPKEEEGWKEGCSFKPNQQEMARTVVSLGLGKGAQVRRFKKSKDALQGISKPGIRKLARRGGVKRISGLVYEETRSVLKAFLTNIIRDAVVYTDYARRKTVLVMDVVFALKRNGKILYGFGT